MVTVSIMSIQNGYWIKREFDANGNVIYFEYSDGEIIDNRPKKETCNGNGLAKISSLSNELIN